MNEEHWLDKYIRQQKLQQYRMKKICGNIEPALLQETAEFYDFEEVNYGR